jgi:hypothetical protein
MRRDERPCVGEDLPMTLDAKDLARVFGVALNTIYEWKKAGKLRTFELARPMGAKHWSGRLLKDFLEGGGTLRAMRGNSLEAIRRRA